MDVLPSNEIWHRGCFPLLCEWRRLYRVIEVGVHRGDFAECFLSRSYNCELYIGVDPYLPYHEMPWDRNGDYQTALGKLSRFSGKATLVRETSAAMAEKIHSVRGAKVYSDPFDFIYLDASHYKDDVADDLRIWWDHLSDKGILAGHDWSTENGDHEGVREAVTEFAEKHDLTVYFTPDSPASWYIYKSGMPGPDWVRYTPSVVVKERRQC